MAVLKRMYVELRRLAHRGQDVALGEFEGPLVRFGKFFKGDAVIRETFRKVARDDQAALKRLLIISPTIR
jgi:hypothetical protein